MAVTTMPIQMRRGNEEDYDESKMLPGEFAVSLDEKKLRIAFAPNDTKEIAMQEDLDEIENSYGYRLDQLESNITDADGNISEIQETIGQMESLIDEKVDSSYIQIVDHGIVIGGE